MKVTTEQKTNTPIRIGLADESTIFRKGLCRLLDHEPDFKVCFETALGTELLEMLRQQEIDF